MSEHYRFITEIAEQVMAFDEVSESIFFVACGETCCEINGVPFLCESVPEFWEMVEMFRGENFAE